MRQGPRGTVGCCLLSFSSPRLSSLLFSPRCFRVRDGERDGRGGARQSISWRGVKGERGEKRWRGWGRDRESECRGHQTPPGHERKAGQKKDGCCRWTGSRARPPPVGGRNWVGGSEGSGRGGGVGGTNTEFLYGFIARRCPNVQGRNTKHVKML